VLDAMLSDYAQRRGKRRWVEKSAGQPVGPVMKLFPDARVIHIVRDPRDVVASSLRTPWTNESATALSESWRAFTLDTIWRGIEIGPAQFLQVRYEDLTRDPAAVMRVVCAFIEEEYDPGMVAETSRREGTVPSIATEWQGRALGQVEPARIGGWTSRLGRVDQLRVNAVVGPMLTPLGYRPPTPAMRALCVPLSVAAAARRLGQRRTRRPKALSPEERYRLKRRFLEQQTERVRAARV
jgi:hypothetical protein